MGAVLWLPLWRLVTIVREAAQRTLPFSPCYIYSDAKALHLGMTTKLSDLEDEFG